ncbi:23S rRNA accumulation protein YceD [Glaciecola petra]|uniref:Large ribosomal RNA subunit accumulation protein YceD n=1 Tax=Glaciecola petra TaxID=3075602 RepID=A0ABU2ZSC2_9ALTE|nr:23S rRNA accumulation protein YceD [Aestuariibacter sp. P117]MDT0594337.1 23S rRNA accumulation protein YceD [Aestuariibacter sp. P117]
MANVKLPKKLDPYKSAQKLSSYVGKYLAQDMHRFNEAVESINGDILIEVEFSKDAQSLTYFKGNAKANVVVVCQRCNKCFEHSVNTEFCFAPVQGNQDLDIIPDAYEPVEVNDHGEVDLFELLEDELILALPIVALHAQEDCEIKADDLQFGEIEPEQERKNPFAVLKELKRD